MITFNLLPYREGLRLRKRQEFLVSVVIAGLFGLILAVPSNMVLEYVLEQENLKNRLLKDEIGLLEKKIGEVADFEVEISALESRRKAVENLQSERNLPVQILADLTRLIPEGVYLTSMSQESKRFVLSGVAQSNQRVSDLLKSLETKGQWIGSPELVEISAVGTESNSNNQPSTVQFTMYIKLKQQSGSSTDSAQGANR